MAESLWKRFAELPVEVDVVRARAAASGRSRVASRASRPSCTCAAAGRRASARTSPGTRSTTTASRRPGAVLPLAGAWTLDSFSDGARDGGPAPALGLRERRARPGLRQAGRPLAEVVGREPRPVSFVVSPGLGDPPSAQVIRRWLELDSEPALQARPGERLERRPDPRAGRDARGRHRRPEGVLPARAATPPPDLDLYRRVAEGFPDAFIEDPALTDETDLVLEPHRERITWDAPIHSVADVEALPFPPRDAQLQAVPLRLPAGAARLLRPLRGPAGSASTAAACSSSGRAAGRSSTSRRSSTPTRRTTSRPRAYNEPEPRAGLPASPLEPAPSPWGSGGARPTLRFD